MKLTALEIKQQKFEKTFRGYDEAEVEAFLNLMSNEWEHMVARNRELERKIEEMQEKLKHYERVEEALHETIQAAKESAETKMESARKEADHKIEKAEMQADAIVREAHQERQEIRQSIRRLLDRRKEIIGGIRSYLEVAKESIDEFEKDRAGLFDQPRQDENLREEETASEADQSKKKVSESQSSAHSHANPPGTENIDDLVDDLE